MRSAALSFFLFLLPVSLDAQSPTPVSSTTDHAAMPSITAARRAGDVKIDGRLDESAWNAATPAVNFTQRDPLEGQPVSERTEVRVLVDDAAIYIAARMHESDPSRIISTLARRDESVEGDIFEVNLDSYHDHLSAFVFRITPAGAIRDATMSADGDQDNSWDAVFQSGAAIDALGWTAELRIPLTQLRYNVRGDSVWGVQFTRYIARKQENASFAFTPKNQESGVHRFGHLLGLGRVPQVTRFELMPYVRTRSENLIVASNNPFRDSHEWDASGGLDLKYGLTSDFTLNATFNPDFGQVELDPAVVNLTPFEILFSERRPFFVEGREIFRFGQTRSNNNSNRPEIFNTRRIGRPPQRALRSDVFGFADSPEESTIAGAFKLTGRTAGGWSAGVLNAVTMEETARYIDTLGQPRKTPVEPLTNYFVGRLRRDLRQGNTILGSILTATHRKLDDPELANRLRSSAYVAGLDFNHAWGNREWAVDGWFAASHLRGNEAAIAAAQLSPTRYFQRPDAAHLNFDPTRARLNGHALELTINRISGAHWRGGITYQEASPGFESNDVGFQTRADQRTIAPIVFYEESRPGKVFRDYTIAPFCTHNFNFSGDNTFSGCGLYLEGRFLNFWSATLRGDYFARSTSDRLTRGGPLARNPEGGGFRIEVESDRRGAYIFEAGYGYSWNVYGGWGSDLNAHIQIQPSPAFRLSLSPGVSISKALAQYVAAFDDPGAEATFGRRYVFSTLRQTEPSMAVRLDWTFTPRLSFQFFAQPLTSATDFRQFREFGTPGSFNFAPFDPTGQISRSDEGMYTIDFDRDPATRNLTFGDPDFNFRSLRANAVVRWEYRPGSTLFFVWQQSREGEVAFGDFNLTRDAGSLFRATPENIFIVKASYWISK
ncbi:MAG: carbohydrate binding family 9 domain-containing protein [Anaerolineae bacterium]|nr:carbohydrate binding family 9 domain-containing protein [Gemmatimonadaceae bacterium]